MAPPAPRPWLPHTAQPPSIAPIASPPSIDPPPAGAARPPWAGPARPGTQIRPVSLHSHGFGRENTLLDRITPGRKSPPVRNCRCKTSPHASCAILPTEPAIRFHGQQFQSKTVPPPASRPKAHHKKPSVVAWENKRGKNDTYPPRPRLGGVVSPCRRPRPRPTQINRRRRLLELPRAPASVATRFITET